MSVNSFESESSNDFALSDAVKWVYDFAIPPVIFKLVSLLLLLQSVTIKEFVSYILRGVDPVDHT